MDATWPADADELVALQRELARLNHVPHARDARPRLVAACYVCFERTPPVGLRERAWAAAALMRGHKLLQSATITGEAGWEYSPGLLALREGPLLSAAVEGLGELPDALIVNATGRDHPRRAGLAVHLGALLGVPTVGVTDRTLVAGGQQPGPRRGDREALSIGDDHVGYWLRTRARTRPVAVHAGWESSPDGAVEIATRSLLRARTPQPLRIARRLAREARAEAQSSDRDAPSHR